MAATNTTITTITTATTNVQQVTKKSSDELLRKFAELGGGDESDEAKKVMRAFKRRRKNRKTNRVHEIVGDWCESPSHYNGGSFAERKSLLPVSVSRKSVLLKQLGICRSHHKASRDVKNKSFLATIEKVRHCISVIESCFLGLLELKLQNFFDQYTWRICLFTLFLC